MDASVWVAAVAGVVGAATGAAASIWATLASQRHEARVALKQRQTELARSAVDIAMTELNEVFCFAQNRLLEGKAEGWTEDTRRILQPRRNRVRLAAMRIPDAEVRTRLKNVLDLMTGWDDDSVHEQEVRIQVVSQEGLEMLGAYLRGDRLPEARFTSDRMRQRRSEVWWRLIDEGEAPGNSDPPPSP